MDRKKAFDTIDNNILLTQIVYYGLGGIESKWISSYLKIGHSMCNLMDWSQAYKIWHVVFHKALFFAPKLFLMYIN